MAERNIIFFSKNKPCGPYKRMARRIAHRNHGDYSEKSENWWLRAHGCCLQVMEIQP